MGHLVSGDFDPLRFCQTLLARPVMGMRNPSIFCRMRNAKCDPWYVLQSTCTTHTVTQMLLEHFYNVINSKTPRNFRNCGRKFNIILCLTVAKVCLTCISIKNPD